MNVAGWLAVLVFIILEAAAVLLAVYAYRRGGAALFRRRPKAGGAPPHVLYDDNFDTKPGVMRPDSFAIPALPASPTAIASFAVPA